MSLVIVQRPTRRKLANRIHDPIAMVVHNSGETNPNKIFAAYEDEDGYQPHYLILCGGDIYQFAEEDKVALHVGMDDVARRLYASSYSNWCEYFGEPATEKVYHYGAEFPGFAGWRDTWRVKGIQSPFDLVTKGHANALSVGIECQAPSKKWPEQFTLNQYQALAELCLDIAKRYKIRLNRDHVLGHSDCNPIRRCNAIGSWDPGPRFSWNRLFDLISMLEDTPTIPG